MKSTSKTVLKNGILITHKSGGRTTYSTTVKKTGNRAFVAPDAPEAEQPETKAVPTPKCFSAKPTTKATQSKVPAQQAEAQPVIQTSPRMSKVGSSNGGHRQTFTWGGQTIPIH